MRRGSKCRWVIKPKPSPIQTLPAELCRLLILCCPTSQTFRNLLLTCRCFGCYSRELQQQAKLAFGRERITTSTGVGTTVRVVATVLPDGSLHGPCTHTEREACEDTECSSQGDGETVTSGWYESGAKQGVWETRRDGILLYTTQYLDDQQHGERLGWDQETGQLTERTVYRRDKRLCWQYYHEGRLVEQGWCKYGRYGPYTLIQYYNGLGHLCKAETDGNVMIVHIVYRHRTDPLDTGPPRIKHSCKFVRRQEEDELHHRLVDTRYYCKRCGAVKRIKRYREVGAGADIRVECNCLNAENSDSTKTSVRKQE